MASPPAYRIETKRLVIRCWNPGDAPLAHAAILASLDHLEPWMPWIQKEPQSLEQRTALLRQFRGKFDLGEDFTYGIFNPAESEVWGGTGLHTRRGEGVREIGYWIRADQVNRGYATESSAALIRVAFEIDRVRRVEIRCDPANEKSAAIPRKLGFTNEGILRQRDQVRGAGRDTQVWSLLADEYPASPSGEWPIRAFDATGELLLE